jgi:hypothetical protein
MDREQFQLKQSQLLTDIPDELKGAFSYLAWELGHSSGYSEVLCYLSDLVDGLNDSIKTFENRIIKDEQFRAHLDR